ncbi:LysR family transcriptional regulator [Endozoicomonas sp. OPT23]|uniref:LysR family transcriptional regulator n=1 Tax=Endozoicomonas sp. OPT23 TaxID=2072845 RepID=UPI00129AB984|nr:LysR family transcriptional regulator [Endozoicomonas sp. OPT23]MRI35138.1 LysR family transcriptional regulator [Endozoicomonas sp. OPT23]
MNQFGALAIFVAVVESNGFAAAARKLGLSKSAVSKRITQLEEHLGVQLLHRSTRKLSLTEAGERYLSRAIEALNAAQEAEDSVFELQGSPKGQLKISVPMSFGRLHIAPLVPEFLSNYPGISINMVMEDRVMDLVGEGFDLAIRGGKLADSSLIARKIAPCHNLLVATPAYLKKHGTPETVSDLHDHNCLHYVYSKDSSEWVLMGRDETVSIQTTGNFLVNNSEALMTAILGNCGIGRLTTFTASEYLKSGELVQVLPDYRLPQQTMYAVYPERKHLPAKVRAFIDFIIDKIGKDKPHWDAGINLRSDRMNVKHSHTSQHVPAIEE